MSVLLLELGIPCFWEGLSLAIECSEGISTTLLRKALVPFTG